MATEMVCGNCQGRLMVEQTGLIVACPHCGAHLQIGELPQLAPPMYYPPPGYAPQHFAPGNYPYPNTSQPDPQYAAQHPSPNQSPAPQFEQISPPSPPIPESHSADSSPGSERPAPPSQALPPIPTGVTDTRQIDVDLAAASVPATAAKATESALPETEDWTLKEDWMPKIDTELPEPMRVVSSETADTTDEIVTLEPVADELVSMPEIVTKVSPTEIWKSSQPPTPTFSELTDVSPVATSPAEHQPESLTVSESAPSGASAPVPDFSGFSDQPASLAISETQPQSEFENNQGDFTAQRTAPSQEAPLFQSEIGEAAQSTANQHFVATQPAGVSKRVFSLVLSYASAITLGFIYLWLKTRNGSALDLPDRKPAFKNGQVGISIYPDGPLPFSHRLKLGQSKQFGSLRITPIKVTKGRLEFESPPGSNEAPREPSFAPVLKLWVRFENVSSDQTFPALDDDLVYTQVRDRTNTFRTNNFLRLEGDSPSAGTKISVYDWLASSKVLMKGQDLDRPLQPGETWETYIPTNDEAQLDTLEGPLAWRVHFRKGYNRTTFRGVTTIVEVDFDSADIQSDS
jgi:hypothetical protein